MDTLKNNFAKKLQALRAAAGMTQSELGEKISYSDKTVSKWERGEAIPDAAVLKQLSRIFSVSVDYLLEEDEESPSPAPAEEPVTGTEKPRFTNYPSITRVVLTGIWTVALLIFVLLWIVLDTTYWMIFVTAVPLTAVAFLVFNSLWNRGRGNFWIVSALVLSILVVAYLMVLPVKNAWQLFLLAVPAELMVYLSFRIRNRRK